MKKKDYLIPIITQTATSILDIVCLSATNDPADPNKPWDSKQRPDEDDTDVWEHGLW